MRHREVIANIKRLLKEEDRKLKEQPFIEKLDSFGEINETFTEEQIEKAKQTLREREWKKGEERAKIDLDKWYEKEQKYREQEMRWEGRLLTKKKEKKQPTLEEQTQGIVDEVKRLVDRSNWPLHKTVQAATRQSEAEKWREEQAELEVDKGDEW